MKNSAVAGMGAAVALGAHLGWIRPRIFRWGATSDEARRPMAGDDLCPRPQLNATRAVTIAATPEDIWPWLVQWGWNRAGFYSYDLLDNLGRSSARRVLPQFQHLVVGDWVPMGGKPTPSTAYRVTRLEPCTLMLWEKPGGTWLWLLEPADDGRTRLITRLRSRYAWARPAIVTELILMEIGDPFMMRKCLLGIKERAEDMTAGSHGPSSASTGGDAAKVPRPIAAGPEMKALGRFYRDFTWKGVIHEGGMGPGTPVMTGAGHGTARAIQDGRWIVLDCEQDQFLEDGTFVLRWQLHWVSGWAPEHGEYRAVMTDNYGHAAMYRGQIDGDRLIFESLEDAGIRLRFTWDASDPGVITWRNEMTTGDGTWFSVEEYLMVPQ